MFTVECAFRLTSSGIEFRVDDDPPEDEMCELRILFEFEGFHAPERDNGSGLTWNDCRKAIEFRSLGEQWHGLTWAKCKAARIFLETHCRDALDEAEREAALETYYGR
jgi:hypothetical protein